MDEKEYYNEISSIIENIEVNSRVREIQDNSEKLQAYWNIGKILVDAQGGQSRARYGDNLIKKWSQSFKDKYGKNYGRRNLELFRKFFLVYEKTYTLCTNLSWSHYRYLLSIKNDNERNYYTNLVKLNNLSVRELRNEIKNKAFDRLSYADKENIKLIEDNNYKLTIKDMIKDPILIKAPVGVDHLSEKVLHKRIIMMLEDKFMELGLGFALIGHEYKINIDNKNYFLDLLFFNYELNAFVVIEVKIREFKPKDLG